LIQTAELARQRTSGFVLQNESKCFGRIDELLIAAGLFVRVHQVADLFISDDYQVPNALEQVLLVLRRRLPVLFVGRVVLQLIEGLRDASRGS
jgi:hypothetical protein